MGTPVITDPARQSCAQVRPRPPGPALHSDPWPRVRPHRNRHRSLPDGGSHQYLEDHPAPRRTAYRFVSRDAIARRSCLPTGEVNAKNHSAPPQVAHDREPESRGAVSPDDPSTRASGETSATSGSRGPCGLRPVRLPPARHGVSKGVLHRFCHRPGRTGQAPVGHYCANRGRRPEPSSASSTSTTRRCLGPFQEVLLPIGRGGGGGGGGGGCDVAVDWSRVYLTARSVLPCSRMSSLSSCLFLLRLHIRSSGPLRQSVEFFARQSSGMGAD